MFFVWGLGRWKHEKNKVWSLESSGAAPRRDSQVNTGGVRKEAVTRRCPARDQPDSEPLEDEVDQSLKITGGFMQQKHNETKRNAWSLFKSVKSQNISQRKYS